MSSWESGRRISRLYAERVNLRYRRFEVAGRKCEGCGKPAALKAHQLDNNYENLGFKEVEDIQALCRGCHERTHASGYYREQRGVPQTVPVDLENVNDGAGP